MPGATCAPAASHALEKSIRVSHHRFARRRRHSLREWCYGLFRALPGDRAFLSPSSVRCASIVTNLISASRYQNHTTSPSAIWCTRQLRQTRPSHPAPTLVTMTKRPSLRARDARLNASDLPDGLSGIFFADPLDIRANQPAAKCRCEARKQVMSSCLARTCPGRGAARSAAPQSRDP
jgi:hypothetical protein